jgi:hypothetical protein
VFAFFDLTRQLRRLASLGLGGAIADASDITAVYAVEAMLLPAAAAIGWTGGLDPRQRTGGEAGP